MSRNANSLIGQTLIIGKYSITIREKIGEGGYAWVYRAQDDKGNDFAYKFVNCLTKERYDQFKQEAIILNDLPSHPNIIKLYGVQLNEKNYLIHFLFEFCPLTAIGILSKRIMTREEILIFFTAICEATSFLHEQKPPIIHRDLKPENLLVSQDGIVKLCDFGSATTKIYQITKPDEINQATDDIERNTTQNYRAPEMVDLYKRIPIGPAVDVWALGCTLYKLIIRDDIYKPEDRLPILQGRVNISNKMDEDLAQLIKQCIQVDPKLRPTSKDLSKKSSILRGSNYKINIPIKQNEQINSLIDNNNNQENSWNWLKSVQETYRSITSSGAQSWAINATYADNLPPSSSYVRKIIVAAIRHTEVEPLSLIDYLLSQRPWQSDVRIATKTLYLILLLLQYQIDLTPFLPISVKIDQIMAFFVKNKNTDPTNKFYSLINYIGSILRTKLMLHAAHKELEGNFAFSINDLSDHLLTDSIKYLKTIYGYGKNLFDESFSTDDYTSLIMCQPIIEEISNISKIIFYLNQDNNLNEILLNVQNLFNNVKKVSFLNTSIDFPDFNIKPLSLPLRRFVSSK